jgi:hypothetical protein
MEIIEIIRKDHKVENGLKEAIREDLKVENGVTGNLG